ncbi:unnamed protein product, partial [Candidula unifasciata]
SSPLSWILACIPSCSCCTIVTDFFGQPYSAMIFHNPSLWTESKSSVRSIKALNEPHCCS